MNSYYEVKRENQISNMALSICQIIPASFNGCVIPSPDIYAPDKGTPVIYPLESAVHQRLVNDFFRVNIRSETVSAQFSEPVFQSVGGPYKPVVFGIAESIPFPAFLSGFHHKRTYLRVAANNTIKHHDVGFG